MNISLRQIPTNIDEFVSMRNELATTPEGGAAMFILAMIMYAENQSLAMQAFAVAMDRSNLQEDSGGYKGFSPASSFNFHFQRFAQNLYWGKAYISGTSPATQYKLPPAPYIVSTSRNAYSEQDTGDIKVFVVCSGADSPRPITLKANDKGYWKVKECSSMFLGMRAPENTISDDL